MPADTRSGWAIVGPERLAEIVARLARERRADRLGPAVLGAALAATGARAGRLVGTGAQDGGATLAAEGTPGPVAEAMTADVPGRDGSPHARLELWGSPPEPDAEAALRLVALAGAGAFQVLELERRRAEDRRRARRVAAAVQAVRELQDPRGAVARLLAEARAVTGAPAAALVAAGARLEAAAYDGMEPLDEGALEELVPVQAAGEADRDRAWSAAVDPRGTLGGRGYRSLAVVPVGRAGAIGYLAVLGHGGPLGPEDLDALCDFAAGAATALTAAVLEAEVRDLGAVDPLTRFFNARYFRARLDQEVERSRRAGAPLALAIMCLDGAAEARAQGRHGAADAAVEALSACVAEHLRGMDVGCRLDEDRIAAILPEVEGLDALRVGERLRRALSRDEALGDEQTLSVGVASFPEVAGTAEALVANASSALEWARAHGGDRTFVYSREAAEILRAEERRRGAEEETLVTTLAALAASVDAASEATHGHSGRVAGVAALISAEMGLDREHVEAVRTAALLHDVGKIGLCAAGPDGPDPADLRRHPELGERMLSGCRLARLRPWVRHHHERLDGRGYPDGLAGRSIPLEARVIAVADAFDHLRRGTGGAACAAVEALRALRARAGTELDPAVVEALAALVGRRGPALWEAGR